jgi:hypothetical protein
MIYTVSFDLMTPYSLLGDTNVSEDLRGASKIYLNVILSIFPAVRLDVYQGASGPSTGAPRASVQNFCFVFGRSRVQILVWPPVTLTAVPRGFPPSLLVNAWIVHQFRLQSLPHPLHLVFVNNSTTWRRTVCAIESDVK